MVVRQANQLGNKLDAESLDHFRAQLRGELLLSDDIGYESARRVWNSMIEKRPAMIVQCSGTADVVASVIFARDHGIEIAVRGGGHNVAGNSINDGGIVIDLSLMRGVQVDASRLTARVQGGATWGEVDHETQLHGLVTPGGQVSSTGVAGFTLAGGMDITRRKWGLACDNLISAEIVTADGKVVTASERHNFDLFWAICGGGGNFGIVTWFDFQLYPLGTRMFVAATMYPMDVAGDILRQWNEYFRQAPDEVTTDVALWNVLPLEGIPPELVDTPVIIVLGFFAGSPQDGERTLQPLRQFGDPILDLSQVWRFADFHKAFDPLFPDTQRYYWKSLSFPELSDDIMDALVQLALEKPTTQTPLALRGLGGAMGRIPEDATAYGNRDALYNLSIDTTWDAPADDERMIAWTREAWSKVHELTGGGVYLNFAGLGEDNDDLARGAYGRNYERLREVKRMYDPDNLFRGNVNITP